MPTEDLKRLVTKETEIANHLYAALGLPPIDQSAIDRAVDSGYIRAVSTHQGVSLEHATPASVMPFVVAFCRVDAFGLARALRDAPAFKALAAFDIAPVGRDWSHGNGPGIVGEPRPGTPAAREGR